MLDTITLDIIEASFNYRRYYTLIVEECIKHRKKRKHTLEYLGQEIAVNRQKLSKFEKLQIHDMALASNYLEFYAKELYFSIKQLSE